MRELLDPPTAGFAATNLLALGALQALEEAGMRTSENIFFASFDDVSWFPLLNPPVTVIAQPVGELGAAASGLPPEIVEGKDRSESVILEARLVICGSCSAAPGG
jgi:LacI family transcriptional regulator